MFLYFLTDLMQALQKIRPVDGQGRSFSGPGNDGVPR